MDKLLRKVVLAEKTRKLLIEGLSEDIKTLCTQLKGKVNELATSPQVLHDLVALNDAIKDYLNVLADANETAETAFDSYIAVRP